MARRGWMFIAATAPICFFLFGAGAHASSAQPAGATATFGLGSPGSAVAGVAKTVRGRVINGLNGSAMSRVLVSLNGKSVLTDAHGQFEFPGVTRTDASISVTRPGYSSSRNSNGRVSLQQQITDLDAALEFKLYPDGIVTGVVSGPSGLPFDKVPLTLQQRSYDGFGRPLWLLASATRTNLRGEYRFRVPAGSYRLTSTYVVRSEETGEPVLPVSFPPNSSSSLRGVFKLGSGQEAHIDLRPRTGRVVEVRGRVEPKDLQGRIQMFVETPGGEIFPVQSASQPGSGTFLINLPAGSYTLSGLTNDRNGALSGTTRITVTNHALDGVLLHLDPEASLPVELAIDAAAVPASDPKASPDPVLQYPDLRQFNFSLRNLANHPNGWSQDAQLIQREDKTYEFHAAPGRYRLEGFDNLWRVESATYGVTNLFNSDIVIASGGAESPIRIVVGQTSGLVRGTVTGASSTGEPVRVYLVPRVASLMRANTTGVGPDGHFVLSLAAGSYLAFALDRGLQEDLRDPEVLAEFSKYAKQIDVLRDGSVTVDLELIQEKEGAP